MTAVPRIREYNLPEPLEESRKIKTRTYKKRVVYNAQNIKCGLCVVLVAAFLIGLALTSLTAGIGAKGQELNTLKNEIASMQTENERLKLEKKRLMSLENIQFIAINELGMSKPQFESLKMVSLVEMQTMTSYSSIDSLALANDGMIIHDGISVGQESGLGSSFISAVENVFSDWAVTGKR